MTLSPCISRWAAARPRLWPEARFNLSGFCTKDGLIKDLVALSEAVGYELPLRHVHGSPDVALNSGRFAQTRLARPEAEQLVRFYNERNIGVLLTFSSYDVTTPMLLDESVNFLLDTIWRSDRQMNGVVLSSPVLNDYLKSTYPGLSRHASILKVVADNGKGSSAYYHRLSGEFDAFTLHPDDALNTRLLTVIADLRSHCEILINENCLAHCAYRLEHYQLLSRLQAAPHDEPVRTALSVLNDEKCQAFETGKQIGAPVRNLNLSRTEVASLYELGFRRFKLQGRNEDDHVFLFDCARFLFDDETIGPFIFKLFCTSEEYGIHKHDRRD